MDISNNPKTPDNINPKDIYERLEKENFRDELKNQHTTLTACSRWAPVDREEIMRIFQVIDIPRPLTDEEMKDKMLEVFNQTKDPLSVESLKEKFPAFPDEWYEYMSRSAMEKITLIKEEEKVKKVDGDFKISFE